MNKKFWLQGNYFRRNFIIILLITSIPGMIIGGAIYWFGAEKIEHELQILHQKHVNQQAKHLNSQLQELEVNIAHLGFDPELTSDLNEINFIKEFSKTHNLTQSVFMLQESNPLIAKAYLYVDAEQKTLFNPEYNPLTNMKETEQLQSLLSNKRGIYWRELPETLSKEKGKSSLEFGLIHNIPSRQSNNVLIVKLESNKITQLVKELNPYNEGAAFLVENDHLIAATNSMKDFRYEQDLHAKILEQKEPRGSFMYEWNGSNYSVSFGEMKRVNAEWSYISISPMTAIVKPIIVLSKIIILISVSGFILSIIITWVATRKIYSPLEKLMKALSIFEDKKSSTMKTNEFKLIEDKWHELAENSQQLQNQLLTHIPALKNGFLMQLTQGHLEEYSERDLYKRMKGYGWEIENPSFLFIDIQLTGVQHIKGSFSQSEDSTISFVASNVIKELAEEQFVHIQMMDFHDLSFGILIIEEKRFSTNESLMQFANIVTQAINEILNLQVTVTIGDRTSKIKEIPTIYEKVKHGKRLRYFNDKNQVIHLPEEEKSNLLKGIYYPFTIEKKLIQSIRMEQTEDFEELIQKFMLELIANESKEINIQQGVIHLFNSFQGEIMQSGFHPLEIYDGEDIIQKLMQHREPSSIIHCFMEDVIRPFMIKLQGRQNHERKKLVEQVIAKIQESYMEDISLEMYADQINTNPYTLSKTFKEIVGINFIDYLTDLRIEKAKQLLSTTDEKISDISEQVGYRHSYFNRIFKKQVGVTPSQYRQTQRMNEMQKSTIAGK